jgi:hypothetical protein
MAVSNNSDDWSRPNVGLSDLADSPALKSMREQEKVVNALADQWSQATAGLNAVSGNPGLEAVQEREKVMNALAGDSDRTTAGLADVVNNPSLKALEEQRSNFNALADQWSQATAGLNAVSENPGLEAMQEQEKVVNALAGDWNKASGNVDRELAPNNPSLKAMHEEGGPEVFSALGRNFGTGDGAGPQAGAIALGRNSGSPSLGGALDSPVKPVSYPSYSKKVSSNLQAEGQVTEGFEDPKGNLLKGYWPLIKEGLWVVSAVGTLIGTYILVYINL